MKKVGEDNEWVRQVVALSVRIGDRCGAAWTECRMLTVSRGLAEHAARSIWTALGLHRTVVGLADAAGSVEVTAGVEVRTVDRNDIIWW